VLLVVVVVEEEGEDGNGTGKVVVDVNGDEGGMVLHFNVAIHGEGATWRMFARPFRLSLSL
jgi:hypothetical protein